MGSPTAASMNGTLTPHGPGTPRTPRSPRPSSRGAGSAGPAAATAASRPAGKALGIAAMRLASTGHLIPQQPQSLPQAPAAGPKLGRSSSLTDLHAWHEDAAMGSPHLRSPPMPADPPEAFAVLGGSPAAPPPPPAASAPLTVPRMDSFASSSSSSMALAPLPDVAMAPMAAAPPAAAPPAAAVEGPAFSELDPLVEFSPGMADMALKYGGMHFSTDSYPAAGLGAETASGTGSVGTALHPSGSFGSGLDSDLGILLWQSDSSLEGGPLDLHASVHN